MNVREWLKSLPGSPSITAAASAAGIQKTTLLRQLDRGEISAENVIALSRAHGANEVDALVTLGYVTEAAAATAGVPQALRHATNQQLLDEISTRVDPDSNQAFRPDGAIGPSSVPGTVTAIRPSMSDLPDNVAASRRVKETYPADEDHPADPEGPEGGA